MMKYTTTGKNLLKNGSSPHLMAGAWNRVQIPSKVTFYDLKMKLGIFGMNDTSPPQ